MSALLTTCTYAILGGHASAADGLRGRYWWARPERPNVFNDAVVFTHAASGRRLGVTEAAPDKWCAIISALDAVELPSFELGGQIARETELALYLAVIDFGGRVIVDGKVCASVDQLPTRLTEHMQTVTP